jgi:hypothetical protein
MLIGACALAILASPLNATRGADATFDLFIAGIRIGEASMSVITTPGGYAVEGAADFGFLFWGGEGAAVAQGGLGAERLRPARYELTYQGVRRPGRVEIAFEDGRAVRWDSAPPVPPEFAAGRVPVTEEHLAGVMDPLSALVIPAGAVATPQDACRRVLPVFSGYTRFDLALEGAVRAADGSVDCAVSYRPVAGHRPNSPGVERVTAPGALAVSLAPLREGFWGPSRVAVATRFGTFEAIRR